MKEGIKNAIQKFELNNFYESSLNFFNSLGYDSDKRSKLVTPDFDCFIDQFRISEESINKEKALVSHWEEIQFLFQLSDDEIKSTDQLSMFHSKEVDKDYLKSYLFISIALKGNKYSKSDLVNITRQINKQFLQPVLILFHYNDLLCLSVIDRRLNKIDSDKDVLEKVTLIKDIKIDEPHRAHIEILLDMALPNLNVQNFDQLHKEFRRVLDTSVLNKKFYKELSNWYFWASPQVNFPILENESQENSNSIALIRMITRIIFIWFMKERELIPNKLFKLDFIKSILDFDDKNESTYYKAILQNLFFATLNQEMDKREFRKANQNYNITNLYRYEKYFTLNKEEALSLFKDIPFLNGGLFDCLDKPHPTNKGKQGGDEIIRIDGFSDREDSLLKVPDSIFFQEREKTVDLNEIYGTKNKKYKTRGLLDILKSYKFTVEENTPIEEEIALDPELLGQVFENLLASYNPDTQSTARKSTGSYYTPRQIVDYMVNESLKTSLAHLVSQNLEEVTIDDMKTGLEILFAYTEKEHAFNEREVTEIVKVISELKILDPACGSGAFPMGILHKLVFILNKLDKENTIWRKLQEERALRETEEAYKVGDKEERHTRLTEIEEAFNNNTSDYGRKLFLIENCIFGVDIQPIATQISKLRFFISLLVDEKIDKARPNWNIRPMPNLETKFVAANSLIGIEKTLKKDQFLLYNIELKNKEEELKKIRHKYFSAKTQQTKKKYKDEDKRIRDDIKQLLIDDEWDIQTVEKLADWDPYDQNSHADFFDKEWMFGNDGFDIVIANPPYVRADDPNIREQRNLIMASKDYETLWEKWDLYVAFIEKGFKLLKKGGVLEFIISDAYMSSKYAEKSHDYFLNNSDINRINFCSQLKIFEAAVRNIIIEYKKEINPAHIPQLIKHIDSWDNFVFLPSKIQSEMGQNTFKLDSEGKTIGDLSNTLTWGEICYVSYGLRPSSDERYWKGEFTKDELISDKKDSIHPKAYIEGKWINKYVIEKIKYLEWGTERSPQKLVRPTFPELYVPEKIMLGGMTGAIYDNSGLLCNHSITVSVLWKDLNSVTNRSIEGSIKKDFKIKYIRQFRQKLEKNSNRFNLKYLLAILNSKFAYNFLDSVRRSQIGFYPDDLKKLPIKIISEANQQPFIKLVDQILIDKKASKDTQKLEDQIDLMVYKLY